MNGARSVGVNVRGAPAPRRRRAGYEGVAAGSRPVRGGTRRCRVAGREMTVTIAGRDGVSVVVKIVGEIDVHTVKELRTILLGLVDRGCTHVVADFTGVRFCDATGLGTLVAVNNRLREQGGALRLTGVSAAQRRILRITHLDRLFRPYDTVEDALAV